MKDYFIAKSGSVADVTFKVMLLWNFVFYEHKQSTYEYVQENLTLN